MLGAFALVVVQNGIRVGILTNIGKGIANSILLQLIDRQSRDTTTGTIQNCCHPQPLQIGDVGGMILGTDENTPTLHKGWLRIDKVWPPIDGFGHQPPDEIQARLQRIIGEREFLQQGAVNTTGAGRVSFEGRHAGCASRLGLLGIGRRVRVGLGRVKGENGENTCAGKSKLRITAAVRRRESASTSAMVP